MKRGEVHDFYFAQESLASMSVENGLDVLRVVQESASGCKIITRDFLRRLVSSNKAIANCAVILMFFRTIDAIKITSLKASCLNVDIVLEMSSKVNHSLVLRKRVVRKLSGVSDCFVRI